MSLVLAVHISDGPLLWPWQAGGFVVAGLLALWGAWQIRDEEIPQVALFTSVFFVGSLIHFSVGPTSVHLLLNGFLGVLLGRRVCLAIPIGLLLQAVLFGHGGYTTLGVNTCIFVLPALAAAGIFAVCRLSTRREPWPRTALITAGVLIGAGTALLTVVLNCVVLYFGGISDWLTLVKVVFVVHLPVAGVEGIFLGFMVGYLAQVKPELIGWTAPEKIECAVNSLP